VRDEDLDWEIYHALLDGRARTAADLSAAGYDPIRVEASLCRLERYLLVERSEDAVRPLSLQESLLLCQSRNGEDCPFFVENGVIRVKGRGSGKGT
jgi:hypothetical protein